MVLMPNMYKIITVKANAHEVHNTERPTKGSGHGKMIDPRRNLLMKDLLSERVTI